MTDEYYDIDFRQKHPTVKGYWVQADKFNEMYRKATALDKIRAEIEEYKDDKIIHAERNEMIDIVLDIIDRYSKGEQG